MKAARVTAFLLLLFAAGCGPKPATWHATDISGAMPPLSFTLTRANDGETVGGGDYRGKVAILYFGYTHCPDVCPTTLANLADMLRKLGSQASQVRVLFVTVDPNRDTLPLLKKYVAAFAPEIDGLRGTPDQITVLTRRYRVAFSVTPASPGHPYEVTHSSAAFFFDRSGRARLVATSTDNTAGLAADVKQLLDM